MSLTQKNVKDIFADLLGCIKIIGKTTPEKFPRFVRPRSVKRSSKKKSTKKGSKKKKSTKKGSKKRSTKKRSISKRRPLRSPVGKKQTYVNSFSSTMPLVFNLLLVITGKRRACLETSESLIINTEVINECKKIEKEFEEENLGFEYYKFSYKKKSEYIIVFFNTKILKRKYVHDTIRMFNVKRKLRNICPCLACNGGKDFIDRMRVILNYPNADTDCKNAVYYINIYVQYKHYSFCIINYRSITTPNKEKLLVLYKDFTSILKSVGAKLYISISMHDTIDNNTVKKK